MQKYLRVVMIVFFLILTNCAHIDQKNAIETSIKWVTVDEIQKSLDSKPPLNVGFDIDDTVLFSSPGFFYGMNKYSPESDNFLGKPEFWEEMNNGLDQFSIPKQSAVELIEMHKKRGDSIYFITARTATPSESVTVILGRNFKIENPNKVIFAGSSTEKNTKVAPIIENNIQIYYGDSDGDVRAAKEAGIRPIRIMRAGNSTYKPLPVYGKFGEEVLKDSMF